MARRDRRAPRPPVPTWWRDAKLGIFIHWTPSSVPGFAPRGAELRGRSRHNPSGVGDPIPGEEYSEWYRNSMRVPGSATADHHRRTYGDRPYEAFAGDFEDALDGWDPEGWADSFAAAGARYVVLVTKHHDGWCLWPTAVRNPNRRGWASRRDVVGELAEAVRARGLRFGVYYSGGLDWTFDDRPIASFSDLVSAIPTTAAYRAYAAAQVRELIDRYRPAVLWNDIAWPAPLSDLRPLLDHHAATVPDGVINDRWMPSLRATARVLALPGVGALLDRQAARTVTAEGIVPPRPPVYDYRTPEYARFDRIRPEPWEACRGMDQGFGYNRHSTDEDHIGRADLHELVADVVSKGGNLLLNVGPRGEDAAVPPLQQQRLDWLAGWLGGAEGNPAIHRTAPWVRAESSAGAGVPALRYTARGSTVWATVLGPPGASSVRIPHVAATPSTSVSLADGTELRWSPAPGSRTGVEVELPTDPGDGPLGIGLHHVTG